MSSWTRTFRRGVEKALGLNRVFDQQQLLADSDIVSIHTPLTPETTGAVDAEFLAAMKPTGVFINVSRGRLVQSLDVLHDTLKGRPEFCVGLDVLPEEPPRITLCWRRGVRMLPGSKDASS